MTVKLSSNKMGVIGSSFGEKKSTQENSNFLSPNKHIKIIPACKIEKTVKSYYDKTLRKYYTVLRHSGAHQR